MDNTKDTVDDQKAEVLAKAETTPNPSADTAETGHNISLTDDQWKVINAQGGFDKFFDASKRAISNPVKATQAPVEAVKAPETYKDTSNRVDARETAPRVPEGYVTQQEQVAKLYFNNLANEEAYRPIASEIRSGEIFKGMAKLGIRPIDGNGNIDEGHVREYLNLRVAGIAAKEQADTLGAASAAPTVDYIGAKTGKIESVDEALAIMRQSQELRQKGQAENPNQKAALEYLAAAMHGDTSKLHPKK